MGTCHIALADPGLGEHSQKVDCAETLRHGFGRVSSMAVVPMISTDTSLYCPPALLPSGKPSAVRSTAMLKASDVEMPGNPATRMFARQREERKRGEQMDKVARSGAGNAWDLTEDGLKVQSSMPVELLRLLHAPFLSTPTSGSGETAMQAPKMNTDVAMTAGLGGSRLP